LFRRGAPLRALLIASDTGGIPKVENEIDDIYRILKRNPKGLVTDVTILKTADATLETVCRELEQGPYHIVHYAGHGEFVAERTQHHRLLLKRARDVVRSGGVPAGEPQSDFLEARQLKILWSVNRPSLFYMSACRGAAVGETQDLFNNDLLGLIDAAISAGVPSVVGFRWPVSDQGAYALSTVFYEELLKSGRPDHALRSARAKVYFKDRDDPAWLSSVLVMQPP
jgi:CHAT domain-containing protein